MSIDATFGWYLRNCAHSKHALEIKTLLIESAWPRIKGKFESEDGTLDDEFEFHEQPWRRSIPREYIEKVKLSDIISALDKYTEQEPTERNLEANAVFVCEEFGLDVIELDILRFVLRYDAMHCLENFTDRLVRSITSVSETVATLIGQCGKEVHRRLIPGALLLDAGILSLHTEGNGLAGEGGYLRLCPSLRKPMHRPYETRREWSQAILGEPLATSLTWRDFEHLRPERDLAANLLTGMAGEAVRGVNVLVHGPVGTGKTEFAKALATESGYDIWAVGECNDQGEEPSRAERLASLRMASRLLGRKPRALLLFDEAEDILNSLSSPFGKEQRSSKVFLCRMLEDNAAPVIWTCNRLSHIDPAILRRMTLAFNVKVPGPKVRERIWTQTLDQHGLDLPSDAISRLARRFKAAPALVSNAVLAVKLAGGGEVELVSAVSGVLQLLDDGVSARGDDPKADRLTPFDLELTNCAEDLAGLVARLTEPCASKRWSMCIEGAPGTGKSEFARYLAERLGMEVTFKRASDLLSMWVGGSEKAIAAAFAEAREEGTLLILDEVDSMLQERRTAHQSWEVTQVNEMLTWMESHPLPFICTTNFSERLDRATLRRFTFKLSFKPLGPNQANLAFERFFAGRPPSPLPDGLAPGDFAVVQRKARIFGSSRPDDLVRWLKEEVEAKEERRQPMGFCAA